MITDRHFRWGEFISEYRYRIAPPEELISITESDLWECLQKISHYRYRSSLECQLISITGPDFGLKMNYLVDVSDIFYFFFCSGRGKGQSEAAGRGRGRFFVENPRGGGLQEGEGPKGREGVCGELGILGGGGG